MPGFVLGQQLGQGSPGTYSRNGDCLVYSRPVNPSDPFPVVFGDAVFGNASAAIAGGCYSSTMSLQANVSGTTSATNVVNGITNTATAWNGGPLVVGQLVVGPGIQQGTTITAIPSAHSITLSNVPTIAATLTLSVLSPLLTTSNVIGIAAREVKTNTGSYQAPASAYGMYYPGQMCDCLERGSVTINVSDATGYVLFGQVHLRVALNPLRPWNTIGAFEAAPDLSLANGFNTIPLTGIQWNSASPDNNGIAEITIRTRLNP